MKKIFTLSSLLLSLSSFSQIYYDFTSANPTGSPAGLAVDTVVNGHTNGTTSVRTSTSVSTGYAGASGTFNAGAATRLNGFDKDTSTYFEFAITPANGFYVSLSDISFGTRSTGTGPQAYSIRTNADSYTSDVATGTITNNSNWALVEPVIATSVEGNINSTLVVRIYGYGGTGSPGANVANWRIDDLTVNAEPASLAPLNLLSFSASVVGSGNNLKWTSANEVNVKGFAIERSSDAIKYSVVSTMAAHNGSEAAYSFTDASPLTGVNYYRLVMTDNDGSYRTSKVVSLINRNGIRATLFPNPVVDNVIVNHTKAVAGSTIKIANFQGQQLKVYTVEQGAIQSSLSVSDLGKGSYILIYQNGTERSVTKFVK